MIEVFQIWEIQMVAMQEIRDAYRILVGKPLRQ
jgi:hypothetical protein